MIATIERLYFFLAPPRVKSTKKKLMSSRVKLLQFYRTLLLAKLLLSSLGFVLNDEFQIFKSFVLLDWFIIFVIDLSF